MLLSEPVVLAAGSRLLADIDHKAAATTFHLSRVEHRRRNQGDDEPLFAVATSFPRPQLSLEPIDETAQAIREIAAKMFRRAGTLDLEWSAEGRVIPDGTNEPRNEVVVHREGAVEWYSNSLRRQLTEDRSKAIHPLDLETPIIGLAFIWERLGVDSVLFDFSLLGGLGACLPYEVRGHGSVLDSRLDRNWLHFQQEVALTGRADEVIQGAIRRIWQSAGRHESPNYAEGQWMHWDRCFAELLRR